MTGTAGAAGGGAAPSLRTFLDDLAGDPSEGVLQIGRTVDRDLEACAVVKALETCGNPVVRFTDVAGTDLPLVFGVTATRERIARALGTQAAGTVEWFADTVRRPLPCNDIEDAPVHEVVWTGSDASLDRLPIGVHSPGDVGRYLTSGVLVLRDPATGNLNTGIYRLMVAGPQRITINVAPAHDASKIISAVAAATGTCDFAIVVGGHPSFAIASQAKNPLAVDAYGVAGALQGRPLDVVRGRTIGLPVPAHAEVVIEGTVHAADRMKEGPFGEFTYYYGEAEGWVGEVTAVTLRRDAQYVDIHPAHVEHRCLWLFPGREARLLEFLRQSVPTVDRVHLPFPGGSMSAVISLKGARPGDARRALMLALSVDVYVKQAVVVDDDIDIFDLDQVHWALTVRFQADRDLLVVPNCRGVRTDPSTYSLAEPGKAGTYTTKMGMDATVPVDRPFGPRADLPPPGFEDLELSTYLPGSEWPGSMTRGHPRAHGTRSGRTLGPTGGEAR